MTFGAPETEALYEGSAQKGFGDPRVDGSPMPLGSLWGRWKSLDDHRAKNPVDQEAKQSKTN
jgi:hypothetical protein